MATALIIGSFSGSNFGDSLVLAAIVHALDERMGSAMRFLVPTNNPGFVERFLDHPRVTSIDIDLRRTRSFRFLGRPVLSVLKSTDVVLTTAGIFFDYRLLDPRFNFISSLTPVLYRAKRHGASVFGLNVGITPPSSGLGGWVLSSCLKAHDHVATRDVASAETLKKLAPTTPATVGADIAHVLFNQVHKPVVPGGRLGVNVASYLNRYAPGDSRHKETPTLLRHLAYNLTLLSNELGLGIDFIATTSSDHRVHLKLAALMGKRSRSIELYKLDFAQALEVFSSIRLFVGSRMHACIISTSMGIPTIALPYHPKVRSYMNEIGMAQWEVPLSQEDLPKLVKKGVAIYAEEYIVRSQLAKAQESREALASRSLNLLVDLLARRG